MAGRHGDAVVILGRFPFLPRCGGLSLAAVVSPRRILSCSRNPPLTQSSVNAALLRGAKTQETPRKAAGRILRLMANLHDYGDIPPEIKVSALEESAREQVNSPFAIGRDEPPDRHLADLSHGGGRGAGWGRIARRERVAGRRAVAQKATPGKFFRI